MFNTYYWSHPFYVNGNSNPLLHTSNFSVFAGSMSNPIWVSSRKRKAGDFGRILITGGELYSQKLKKHYVKKITGEKA